MFNFQFPINKQQKLPFLPQAWFEIKRLVVNRLLLFDYGITFNPNFRDHQN